MTRVVSIRLRDDQVDRLKRFARRMGKSQSEMGTQFIEEAMREAEFANIEFRDSVLGAPIYPSLARTIGKRDVCGALAMRQCFGPQRKLA